MDNLMNTDDKPYRFADMTTNERLFAAGLMPKWDDACRRRDRKAMTALLFEVIAPDFSESDAARCADEILANPQKYLWHLEDA